MDQLPRDVTIEALALSPAEMRAFPRWYTNLLVRKHTETITIGDVTSFVDNFGVTPTQKQGIERLFGLQLVNVDPLQFYIYLRLVGHILQGKSVRKELAYVAAPVPKPRSILAKRDDKKAVQSDMDSFMSLMTGNGSTPQRANGGVQKRKKRVTFDSRPPQISEAAHRSMSELLRQSNVQEMQEQMRQFTPDPPAAPQPPPTQEPEPDQPIVNNQFAHVNIDSVLHNGISMLPEPPAPRKAKAGDSFIQQLTANTQQPASQTQHQPSSQPSQPPPQPPQPQQQPQTQSQPQPPLPRNQSQANSSDWWKNSQPRLRAQSTGSLPVTLQPQLEAQLTGMSPQVTGAQSQLQPRLTGQSQVPGMPRMPGLQPQASGPVTSQIQGMQHLSAQMQPQLSGQIQPQLSGQIQPQLSGQIQPQLSGQIQPQLSGQIQQQLSGQVQPQLSGQMQPQLSAQQLHMHSGHLGVQSQLSGMQPQISRLQRVSPQISGNGLPMGVQSQMSYGGPSIRVVQPGLQGNYMQSGMQPQLSGQVTGMQPQLTGQLSGQFAGPPHGMQPQVSGQNVPGQPGMQFLNSVQNPPSQYGYGQAYNMQGLRNELPNW